MTHADLVRRAARWLRTTAKCNIVLTEVVSSGLEIPDAIGWKYGDLSTLIECKASRADFLRDAGKLFRRHGQFALGARRYYLTPAGLLSPDDLPPSWGLLEVRGRCVRKVKDVGADDLREAGGMGREIGLLVSSLRRVEVRHGRGYVDALAKELSAELRESSRRQRERIRSLYVRRTPPTAPASTAPAPHPPRPATS